ncbi:MAG: hypothetical protein J6W88_01965, partial [Bacteroidales bacterium]|nr:hypothetical protein [Bacteroidales bacterium]
IAEVMVMNHLQIVDGQRVLDGSFRPKPMILLNIDGYFDPFLAQIQRAHDEGLMRTTAGLVAVSSVEEIFKRLAPGGAEIS